MRTEKIIKKKKSLSPPIKNSKGLFQYSTDFLGMLLNILRASVDNSHVNRSTVMSGENNRTTRRKDRKTEEKESKQLEEEEKSERTCGVEEQPFGVTLGLTRLGFCRMKAREGEQSGD